MGYHFNDIKRGVFGQPSKIREELEEFEDALLQKNPVMAIQELSDIVGAIEGWLDENHPTIHLEHLIEMAHATRRAFQDGTRKAKSGIPCLGCGGNNNGPYWCNDCKMG